MNSADGTEAGGHLGARQRETERLALLKGLLFVEAFRTIRRLMPLQHAYAFLHVAVEEGLGVSEYAKRVGVSQAVMTRILFSLGSSGRRRASGYGLVQQAIDTVDQRRTQTFLTVKGKALKREIVGLVHSDETQLQNRNLKVAPEPVREIARDQWLSRLIEAGDKLDTKDMKLAVKLIEALVRHNQS